MTIDSLLLLNCQILIISICGILMASHIIRILISLELLLVSICLNFVAFSLYHNDICGQAIVLLLLSVVGAESAIGLAILLLLYWHEDDTHLSGINVLGL